MSSLKHPAVAKIESAFQELLDAIPAPGFVHFAKLAEEMGVSSRTMRRWFTEGKNGVKLPVYHVGDVPMVSRQEFDEFVRQAARERETPRTEARPGLNELLGVI